MKKIAFLSLGFILLGFGCTNQANDEPLVESQNEAEVIAWQSGEYSLNTEESSIEWIGRGVGKQHNGLVYFSNGELIVSSEGPVSGDFIADMDSLYSLDIQNENMRNTLDNHLKSDDFFSVENYPTASLIFKELTSNENGTFSIVADMTLRGTTNEITIDEARITQIDENTILAETYFEIDRTEFNVRYGSGRFFQNLGNSLINDTIEFKVNALLNK